MSAYIVDRNHIRFLVESALYMTRQDQMNYFAWWDGHQSRQLGSHNADQVGQELWDECRASVAHLYPGEADLPGPVDEDFVYIHESVSVYFRPTPAEILKSADCYAYQSCSHPGWKESSAHAFITQLRAAAWTHIEGYDAAPWGAPTIA